MGINKVVYGGKTLIDLTGDTVTADKLLEGVTAHGKDGEVVTGACTFDVDSNDANAAVAEVLKGKTAYARGTKIVGTMPNNGAVTGTIKTLTESYVIAQGYHDGSGTVTIDSAEQAKLVAKNIREGITVLGVKGSMSGNEGMKPQTKTVPRQIQSRQSCRMRHTTVFHRSLSMRFRMLSRRTQRVELQSRLDKE